MKIPHTRILHTLAGATHGGAEMAFVDMCIAQKEVGLDVGVVCRPNETRVPILQAAGIDPVLAPFGGALDVRTPHIIKRYAKKFQPHIVQTWMSRAARLTPASKNYVKISRLGGYYKLKYFKTTDHFTTITPMIREYLIGEGIAPKRVTHINNFAEVGLPGDAAATRQQLCAEFNTPEDAFTIVTLSRLHTVKALDTLLHALAKTPNIYAWLAGEGPERESLQHLCSQLQLQDRVRFLGWRTDRDALLQAADACVFPSRYEPFGTVFVQAWAQQTPVITSTADGPRQFVRDGEDALVFDIDDVDQLVTHLQTMQQDAALRKTLTTNGLQRYHQEFAKERVVCEYIKLYNQLI